jgi:antitoxin component of MazEF toxin-antitoxin module
LSNEATFTKKITPSGNSRVIVVPPDVLDYLDAHPEDTFEIHIKKI